LLGQLKRSQAQTLRVDYPHTQKQLIYYFKCYAKKEKQTSSVAQPVFYLYKECSLLLQRDEPRRVCSSNTRATVLDGLVSDGELAQVVAAHLRLWKREIG